MAGVIILVLHPQAVALQAEAFAAQEDAAKKAAFEALFRVLMPIRILYGVTLVLGVVLMGIKTNRSLTLGGATS
jgi:TRAP-type mannitol/chloroaromatic compound transport system permease large subunit